MVYIIAECGQNHNGSLDLACQMIDMCTFSLWHQEEKLQGVNAVKFTKRDMTEELTEEEYYRRYDNPNSFGYTYGEHREALELSYQAHAFLSSYAKNRSLQFVETVCSMKALEGVMKDVDLDIIKIASRDLTNIPLVREVAKAGKPVILSTGMDGYRQINQAVNEVQKHGKVLAIFHCVSNYPCYYNVLNLRSIMILRDMFYPVEIGFSDHTTGILAGSIAVTLGATYIEKHITLDKFFKGTDQAGSLNTEGLIRYVRDIRNTVKMLGDGKLDKNCNSAKKLKRSICAREELHVGHIITERDLIMLSPGDGLSWEEVSKVVGKKVICKIPAKSKIRLECLDGQRGI